MTEPDRWLRERRETLRLSTRDLARLSGVAYPTISRIELGHADPSWRTLRKLASTLGQDISLHSQPTVFPRLADLVGAWHTDAAGDHLPDWTMLRAFADALHQHPEHTAAAIAEPPPPSGSAFYDNLLAAIAEKAADDVAIRRPRWTRRIPRLERQWDSPGTPRMRAANAQRTPPQLRDRNIVIPAAAIWRDRESRPA